MPKPTCSIRRRVAAWSWQASAAPRRTWWGSFRAGSRVVASVPIGLVAGEGNAGDPVLMVADVVKVTPGASATGTPTGETAPAAAPAAADPR